MPFSQLLPTRRAALTCVLLLASAITAVAQKRIACPGDGDHIEIDLRQLSIQYSASSFAATLNGLSVLGSRIEVAPKQLQQATVATQQWNEFLKGLAAGYNSCAITRQQYADGLTRIYPRLQQDGASLEVLRKAMDAGQKIDTQRLQQLLDSFRANLRLFAQASGKEIFLERIVALSEQQKTDTGAIVTKEDSILAGQADIAARLQRIEEANKQAPLPTPAEVKTELRKSLEAKIDQAENAYNKGYALLNEYRYAEAIPLLQEALAAVPLPNFYLAVGRAYTELPDLPEAEKTLRAGLALTIGDEKHEAELANQLALTLLDKGDLDGALQYAQQALNTQGSVNDTEHPSVAAIDINIGQIFQAKGDLDNALLYTQRALVIEQSVLGRDGPDLAVINNNVGTILRSKGDPEGALPYLNRALEIDEKNHGPVDPNVARDYANVGSTLADKHDLDGALKYTQKALEIEREIYGPSSTWVAAVSNNIASILSERRDPDDALRYARQALKIVEAVYGPDDRHVAIVENNMSRILQAKGDLNGALRYEERALKIFQALYGPANPSTKISAAHLEELKQAIHK